MYTRYWNVELLPLRNTFVAKTIEVRGFISFEIVLKANKNYSHEIKLFFNLKLFKKFISFQRN